jgi:hypothetical protein
MCCHSLKWVPTVWELSQVIFYILLSMNFSSHQYAEPVFVNLLRSPVIDSQHGGPVQQPYLTYRPARPYRLAESITGLQRRLQIRALRCSFGPSYKNCLMCALSTYKSSTWSANYNFVCDGRYRKRGWACTPPHQAGLIFP